MAASSSWPVSVVFTKWGTRLEEVFWSWVALAILKFAFLIELPIRPQISPVSDNKKN